MLRRNVVRIIAPGAVHLSSHVKLRDPKGDSDLPPCNIHVQKGGEKNLNSGCYSPASHRAGPGSILGQLMWDFSVDKVASGMIFSDYFGFSGQLSLNQLLHIRLSSSASSIPEAIGRIMVGVQSWLTLTTLYEFKKVYCQV
jgi:hypothetical protein